MAFCTLLITYFLLITRKTIFYRSLFYFFKTVINWYLNRLELLFGLIIHFISVLNESYFYVCIMYVSKIYNFLCMILIFSKSYNFVIKWTFFQYFWILFQTSSVGHPKKVSVVRYCGLGQTIKKFLEKRHRQCSFKKLKSCCSWESFLISLWACDLQLWKNRITSLTFSREQS